jgi:hypothetical protein
MLIGALSRPTQRNLGRDRSDDQVGESASSETRSGQCPHCLMALLTTISHTMCDKSSTSPRPITEMMVSITDQVLMVCPTVSPKYSFTNQKPASLT